MKKYGAVKWSDLGGKTNPDHIWSPGYLFLKTAVDAQESPQSVADALVNWLQQFRKVTPTDLNNILRQGPGRALSDIVKISRMAQETENLPTDALKTLTKAVAFLANQYISGRRSELDTQRAELDQLSNDFSECVEEIVSFVTESERRSCGMCERQFGVHDPDASHGNCKRHTIDSYKQIIKLNSSAVDKVEPLIKKVMAMPDENFPPDLAEPQNEQLRNSLMQKDYATHDRETQAYMNQVHRSRGEEPIPSGSSVNSST